VSPDSIYGSSDIATFTIDNLVVGGEYDIYVYGGGGPYYGYGAKITIDGNTEETTYPGNSAFVEGENYVLFEGVVAAGGTITGTLEKTAMDEGDMNGLTIVGDFIPEPATLSLLAIGGGLALIRRRRK